MPSEVSKDYSRQKWTMQLERIKDQKEEDRQRVTALSDRLLWGDFRVKASGSHLCGELLQAKESTNGEGFDVREPCVGSVRWHVEVSAET